MLQTPQRTEWEDQLEAELAARMDASAHCTGCIRNDTSTAQHCESLCLTDCERSALATLKGVSENFVYHSET